MEKVIANRTYREVINRIAKKLSQLSQNSFQCHLLCNFDKNKKGEKRVSASKIPRFWLNRKTYMGVSWVGKQWVRTMASRKRCQGRCWRGTWKTHRKCRQIERPPPWFLLTIEIAIAGYLVAIESDRDRMCRDKMKFKKSFEVLGWAGNSVLGTDNTVLVQYVQYGYNSVKCLSKIELNVIRIKRRSVSFQFGVQLIPEITQERANQLKRNYIILLSERKARVDKYLWETTYPT